MKKILQTLLLLLVFFLSSPLLFNPAWAGFFKFDKTTVSVSNGGTFQIAVTVDPGSDALNSVDAYVTFDSTVLKATEVTAGSLFRRSVMILRQPVKFTSPAWSMIQPHQFQQLALWRRLLFKD